MTSGAFFKLGNIGEWESDVISEMIDAHAHNSDDDSHPWEKQKKHTAKKFEI